MTYLQTMMVRLLSKCAVFEGDECVHWMGGLNADEYGTIWVSGKNQYVHRVVYELMRGPIPADHDVHHTCRMRQCTNPYHLEAQPLKVNRADNGSKQSVEDEFFAPAEEIM